jgi:hypothetical protein
MSAVRFFRKLKKFAEFYLLYNTLRNGNVFPEVQVENQTQNR